MLSVQQCEGMLELRDLLISHRQLRLQLGWGNGGVKGLWSEGGSSPTDVRSQ